MHGAESTWRLYLRDLSEREARPIPGTEEAESPFFSPDGRWLGFLNRSTARLMKLELPNGSPQVICDCGRLTGMGLIGGAEWGEDGWIVLGSWIGMQGLHRVRASGGPAEPIPLTLETFRADEYAMVAPSRLPDGRLALVGTSRDRVAAIDLRSGERRAIIEEGGWPATYVDGGTWSILGAANSGRSGLTRLG